MIFEQREKSERGLLRRWLVLTPDTAGVLRGQKPLDGRTHLFWHVGGQDDERPARGIVGGDVPFVGPEGAVVASAEHVPKNLVPHTSAVLCRYRVQRFKDVQIDADGRVAFVFQHREMPISFVSEQA